MFPLQSQASGHKEREQEQIQQKQPTTPRKSPGSANAAQQTKEAAAMMVTNRHSDYLPNAPGASTNFPHLPTPQSPNNFAHYMQGGLPTTPESPIVHGSYSSLLKSAPLTERSIPQNLTELSTSRSQQIMTPESSPFVQRNLSPSKDAIPTPQFNVNTSFETPTRTAPLVPAADFSAHKTPSPSPTQSSCLSSPFVAKTSIPTKPTPRPHSNSPNSLSSTNNEDFFASHSRASTRNSAATSMSMSISTPPISPVSTAGAAAPQPSSTSPSLPAMSTTAAGGEIERIRQAIQAEQDALENRRPDYLRRTKRTLSEADPTAFVEDDRARDAHRFGTVGIADSPAKGRRITLFQETSEESFEESLMAGGYGLYRTAEWVRQPQPIAIHAPGATGASNVTARLEEAQPEEAPPPPTEKELRKQKRLAAFRSDSAASLSKLYPVELEGKGRVLLDVPNDQAAEEFYVVGGKRRLPGSKRKKKSELTAKEKRALAAAAAAEDSLMKPNWPDTEFPWRLRTEERAEQAKAEEEERLKWIERFLDRDTDEDDDDGESGSIGRAPREEDDDVIPSTQVGVVYDVDDEPPRPFRGGRGKMVPLAGDPDDEEPRVRRRNAFFPSDPADARAALLSKRSVRALSYRQYRRQRKEDADEDDEELLCVCRGRDDGRQLVQCDSCKMWYHLECIGITSIAELGREEDPWYCLQCVTDDEDVESGSKANAMPAIEPTFAPTEPRLIRPAADQSLFSSPSLEDSPPAWNSSPSRALQTPTRSRVGNRDTEFSSGSTAYTTASSRGYPTTPRRRTHGPVFAQSTPGAADGYDESSFDPTSTPSRGIKFGGAQFTTPKNMFSSRSFHTPSRPSIRGPPGSAFGAPGFLSSALDDRGNDYSPYGRMIGYDDSPIRRARSTEGHKARRIFEPSASSRDLGSDPY
ncbi:hypothetical protein D9758_007324 [Tetrapyrgos nigripes]|uniref:PHD-type domain-containing protein n=1 Tax=Tetrapyrgos nigripes TaxID=182062 RepID=A0A8H5GB66_9AGAR|nr:hypothetical protein D9758_007324 [Tetrapyrgos nigripes]